MSIEFTESFLNDEIVSNAYVDKQEEIWVKNHIYVYSISDIYWIDKWCENILKVTDSLKHKCRDASKEIFKLTGKLPEATRDNSIASDDSIASAYVFFSLKELKEIRNYASMYHSSNEKTVGARNTLYDINLRIKYLEKQSDEIFDVLKSGCRESYQLTHKFHTYTKADIFWYAEWALDNCKILYPELYKKIIKGLKLTKESDEIYQNYLFKLHELQNIRRHTSSYYATLNHDQPDRKRSVEESIALCRLDEKIEFLEEWKDTELKLYLENQLPTRQAIGYPSQNTMNLNSYQKEAFKTAKKNAQNLNYMVLGLTSEAGEVAGKLKKRIRDNVFDKKAFLAEVGDVLWYIAGICSVCDVDLEDVAKENINKLIDRQNRNMISGSGDNR